MKKFLSALCVSVLCSLPLGVGAHALWINLTDWSPIIKSEKGYASTNMYLGWGHHYPVDGMTKAADFASIKLYTPTSKIEDIKIEHEGISTSTLKPTADGLYTLSVVRKSSMNTKYLENGKEISIKGPKTGLENVTKSTYSQQFATSVFAVGNAKNEVPRAAGNKFEIVALENPYSDKNYIGELFPIQVLFDGKPAPQVKVTATYGGYSSGDNMATQVSTNRDGIAYVRINHWGPWLFKARYENTISNKLKDLVDMEVYYTSLTLEI